MDDGEVLEGDPLGVEDRKWNVILGFWLGRLGGWCVPFTTSLSGHTQCPPLGGPEPWLAKGATAPQGKIHTPCTESACSCLTKVGKEPLEE